MPLAPSELNTHFTKTPPMPGAKNHVVCNHCHDESQKVDSKSLVRKKKHLDKCRQYQYWLRNQPGASVAEDRDYIYPESSNTTNSNGKRPRTATPAIDPDVRNRKAAMAIYAGGHPLTLFDRAYHPEMVAFIQLLDPTFVGIDKQTIAQHIGECVYASRRNNPHYLSFAHAEQDLDTPGLYSS